MTTAEAIKEAVRTDRDIVQLARLMFDRDDIQILDNDVERVEDGHWVGARVWVPDQ